MSQSKLSLIAGILILTTSLTLSADCTATIQLQPPKLISPAQTLFAAQPQRTALVIGNSHYPEGRELPNPVNDANDIAKELRNLGFEVILVIDGDKKKMDTALENFNQKLRQGSVGLFYYAGHGVSVNNENYLIPIDARLNNEKDVEYEALPVGKIKNAMETAGTDVNIIILDACRDNPFSRKWRTRSLGTTRGLSPIQAVGNFFIAFATAPGETALDGGGKNGTFTSYLLKNIKTRGITIEDLFKRVGKGVAAETQNKQRPWVSASFYTDFSFNPETSNPVASSQQPSPPRPNPTPVPTQRPIQTGPVATAPTVPSQYVKLRDLLAAGRWKEADVETGRVMLVVAKREKEGYIDDDSIKKFSCSDLSTIDQLWVKYSNGRFGFSVQARIYKSLGGTESYNESVWNAYGDRIGWRVNNDWLRYNQLTFDLETNNNGHLPTPRSGAVGWFGGSEVSVGFFWGGGFGSLFSRITLCTVTYKAHTESLRFVTEKDSTQSSGFWRSDTWHSWKEEGARSGL